MKKLVAEARSGTGNNAKISQQSAVDKKDRIIKAQQQQIQQLQKQIQSLKSQQKTKK